MCSNSDNIIINENFEPIAVGMSLAQHKIGKHNGHNVYVRKHSHLNKKYFIQMSQKVFGISIIDALPVGYHDDKFTISKKKLEKIKEKLVFPTGKSKSYNYNSKEEIVTELDNLYSTENAMENIDYVDKDDEETKELTKADAQMIAESVEFRKDHTKKLLDKVDWRKVPKFTFSTTPTLWWEGSDAWNDLGNGDTEGVFDYLKELDEWIEEVADYNDAWKKGVA